MALWGKSAAGKGTARAKPLNRRGLPPKIRKESNMGGMERESSKKWRPRRNKGHVTRDLIEHFKTLALSPL